MRHLQEKQKKEQSTIDKLKSKNEQAELPYFLDGKTFGQQGSKFPSLLFAKLPQFLSSSLQNKP